ncbi:uncharacterized protein LOC134278194 [Saccostrea cucullata]|uniref:uncharacterized protein LOC134278194 n=1 Tax=Saccostrea cuccullata TaxID=36930 RepID=UPI002ED31200
MIFRNVEIPRECMLTLNKKYILIAKYDRNSENIHVDCNDILDWESLSGFQKGRLRRGGYSCGIEICINDCVDNEGCASTHVPLACRMEKEEENCYDKYAECKPNVETSSGDWEMQDKVFSSCQQLENPIPVFVDPSGSGNGTEPTAVP